MSGALAGVDSTFLLVADPGVDSAFLLVADPGVPGAVDLLLYAFFLPRKKFLFKAFWEVQHVRSK